MMRKLFHILTIMTIVLVGTASLSGCFLLPSHNDPESMEINGETYVRGFYDGLYVVGIPYHEPETAAFDSQYHNWWKVDGVPFEMYCAQNKEAMNWTPAVYCRESEFDEVKAYYAETANYDYYIGGWEEGEPRIQLSESDGTEYAERAIQFKAGIRGGIFDPNKDRLVDVKVEYFDWYRAVIYRVSKDGLFTTEQSEWAICNDYLYINQGYDGDSGQATFYHTDEDVSRHMVNLFKKYGLIV